MIISATEKEIANSYNKFIKLFLGILLAYTVLQSILHIFDGGSIAISLYSMAVVSIPAAAFVWILMKLVFRFFASKIYKNNCKVQIDAEALSNQVSAVREVICEGQATKVETSTSENKNLSAGWMIFSEDALEYYEFEKFQNGGSFAILIDDIQKTSVKGNTLRNILVISTKEKTYSFSVFKAETWKEYIDARIIVQ